ncbi:MAG: LPXTG cell wall anchor domain-containing protein [Eubacterium sp.]|jgi:LPXTG-motif cell wall-anchored protein|nr:LPXTG cell wall anchor domain-containing protein [Eubacterium sp.]MCH4046809.1 LPXTG cell wall anchor domain-containing protein [Eubacterium sp.]MCH4079906.1 LPXTG cell wall anchor domain-containing protein [Eubacterium sp.]MCH4110053.1 LPXTG cell wall anchor domain-containing protein [Eubacterium sp.]MCI1306525.1 LPXTG cell wall anchor domain-containing protein [Eubacterium sp.]
MREKGKKRTVYARAIMALVVCVLMVCSGFASSAFADTENTGSNSSAASTETQLGTAYTVSENGNNTSSSTETGSTEQGSAKQESEAVPSTSKVTATNENGNDTEGSTDTGSTSTSMSARKNDVALIASSTDNTSGSSGTEKSSDQTYKVSVSDNEALQIDGSVVYCMNNTLAMPKDGTVFKENTENLQYQELAQNSAFRSEFGYVFYAGSANAKSTADEVRGTRFAVWALMNKYGIDNNDNLNDVAANYQLFSDLFDADADVNAATHTISPFKDSVDYLEIVSTDGSSTPTFTYDTSANAWISSGLKVVAVTADGAETAYTGSFVLSGLPEGMSLSSGGAEGILNTAFRLQSLIEPSESTTLSVSAVIPYLDSITFYSPLDPSAKSSEEKSYQNLISASVSYNDVKGGGTVTYKKVDNNGDTTTPTEPSNSDNNGGSTPSDSNSSGNSSNTSDNSNAIIPEIPVIPSNTDNSNGSTTPVVPSNTDNTNGGSTTPEPVTPSNNNNGSSTTPSAPSNTDNGKSSGTRGGAAVKPQQPAAPSASDNTSAGSKSNNGISPAVRRTSSAVQTNPSIQPASSSAGQTSASAPASGLSADEPKTGDTTDLTLWTALALTSAAGAAALLILRRKRGAEK